MKKLIVVLATLFLLVMAASCTPAVTPTEAPTEAPTTEAPTPVPTPTPTPEPHGFLRVGTYNIKLGTIVGMNLRIIANDILLQGIDVVGFQEIDKNTTRTGNVDTMAKLSEYSGYAYYAFAKGTDKAGGDYGTGILSKYPIESFEVTKLTSDGYEQRSIGHAVINVNGTMVHFFNTHLSYENLTVRTKQIKEVKKMLFAAENFILTGDFNTDDMTEFEVLPPYTAANNKEYVTFPGEKSCIDNIFVGNTWKISQTQMIATKHSDHNLLWADLDLA